MLRARALSKKCKNLLGSSDVLYLIGHLHAHCVTPLTLTVNLSVDSFYLDQVFISVILLCKNWRQLLSTYNKHTLLENQSNYNKV